MLTGCVLVLSLAVVVSTTNTPTCLGCACAINKVFFRCNECPPCCPTVKYNDPVCGFNPCDLTFRTFEHECILKGTICNGVGNLYYKVYDGECTDTPIPTSETDILHCPISICPHIEKPICGFNPCDETFITFPNECVLQSVNCRNPGKFYYEIFKGRCRKRLWSD